MRYTTYEVNLGPVSILSALAESHLAGAPVGGITHLYVIGIAYFLPLIISGICNKHSIIIGNLIQFHPILCGLHYSSGIAFGYFADRFKDGAQICHSGIVMHIVIFRVEVIT